MKRGIIFFAIIILIINVLLVSAETSITIKARLVDALTGEPISGASLGSAYEYTPQEVISDSNGNVQFSVTDNFKLKDTQQIQNGGTYTFMPSCYSQESISFQKDYQIWENGNSVNYSFALTEDSFDTKQKVTEISGKTLVDLGDLKLYPMANLNIKSDIPISYEILYKLKNLGYNSGGGSSSFSDTNYQTNAFPLNYDVSVNLQDEDHIFYKSTTYRVPLDAKCKTINLEFINKAFTWSVSETSSENSPGYIEIDLKKGWNLVPFININNGIANDSEIKKEDIASQYFYLPNVNKFFKLYPLKDDDDVTRELQSSGIDSNWMQNNQIYFINTGSWIYSKKTGKLKANTYGEIGAIYSHRKTDFLEGWNLKVIPETIGNCSVIKIADWDNQKKKWITKSYEDAKDDIISLNDINKIKAIKVASNCQFGDTNEVPIQSKPYPTKIENLNIGDSRMEENCNDNAELNTQQPIGKVCASVTQLSYEDNYEGYSVNLINISVGRENYIDFVTQSLNATSENPKVFRQSSNGILGKELYWFSSGYDVILIKYYTIISENNGKSYDYSTITGFDNPVVKWFLDKYPPI